MSEVETALWQRFAEQAKAGELYLDSEEAARQCLAACDQRVTDLEGILRYAQQAQFVSGFGDFHMADDLQKMFKGQASGEPNSIDAIIREHMEVVKDMGQIMALSIKRISGQDVTNSVHFNTNTESMGA
ncbi:hypothetical protein OG874_05135 [Nocardia sp. NBC_00565]|uniref:hypothetical protein n=1 Tax=Nocardia sp. NBC_00565 TaxID=2975993 RepID=UPI002E81AD9A|nr:hypothetical protein [Nocardia sp. NBC_00565]WUC04578.1 hypothetical protein OG874_05135 [Nocardia sp. NBC_00565]